MNDKENKQQSEFIVFLKKIFVQDLRDTKGQVVDGVIVPQIKSFLSNLSSSLVNNILYGKDVGRQNMRGYQSYNYPVSQINYNAIHYDQNPQLPQTVQPTVYGIGNLQSLRFEVGESEVILEKMNDTIKRWGKVSVADFYDFINEDRIRSTPPLPRIKFDPTTNNYGWLDLSKAKVVRTNDGDFCIWFPKVVPLN